VDAIGYFFSRSHSIENMLLAIVGSTGIILYFVAHLGALIMIPLGLPGTFVQVIAAAALSYMTSGQRLSWFWVAVFFGMALIGEAFEFFSGQWGAKRFGGSKKSAWGALIGGFVGAFVGGIPILIVGSLIMSFVGTFAGALLGEMYHQREISPNLRVGFGALLGRAIGVAIKLTIGILILVISVILILIKSVPAA
jgi:uncharacterized protein